MLARKILSDAATIYDKPMINGATEAFTGIVEQLGKTTHAWFAGMVEKLQHQLKLFPY